MGHAKRCLNALLALLFLLISTHAQRCVLRILKRSTVFLYCLFLSAAFWPLFCHPLPHPASLAPFLSRCQVFPPLFLFRSSDCVLSFLLFFTSLMCLPRTMHVC